MLKSRTYSEPRLAPPAKGSLISAENVPGKYCLAGTLVLSRSPSCMYMQATSSEQKYVAFPFSAFVCGGSFPRENSRSHALK